MSTMQQTNQGIIEQVPFSIGTIHHNLSDLSPTSSEVAYLWTSYMAETMAICYLKKWTSEAKDPEIHPLLQQVLDTSTQRVLELENLFKAIQYPLPSAFGEKDINMNSPMLFSETFTCLYTRMMQEMITHHYLFAFQTSYRSDFRSFYSNCLKTCIEVENKATEILLAKGILQKHPSIVPPHSVENVPNKSYFGTLLRVFGESRPLNAMEICHIYKLIEIGQLVSTLNLGCAQVVKSNKIRDYLLKKKKIIDKSLEAFNHILASEDVPVPSISEILVTDAKESGLSDRIILNHSTASTTFIISSFGLALPAMARKDLAATLRDALTTVMDLAKDGADLLIELGWLEQMPQTADRHELTH